MQTDLKTHRTYNGALAPSPGRAEPAGRDLPIRKQRAFSSEILPFSTLLLLLFPIPSGSSWYPHLVAGTRNSAVAHQSSSPETRRSAAVSKRLPGADTQDVAAIRSTEDNAASSRAAVAGLFAGNAPSDGGRVAGIVFTVTSTSDNGPGTLRQALLDANASPGADTIVFDIPLPGPQIIRPASPLPRITDAVTLA